MAARESFGFALRQQRERQGLTLDSIAQVTKINRRLLDSLERGDLSRWPGGLYRRAFVRAYAAAIDLPAEPTFREFARLFPEPGQALPPLMDDDPCRLRVTLATERRWKALGRRSLAGAADTIAVLLIGYALTTLSGGGLWTLTAVAALTYYALGTAMLGRTPAMWCVAAAAFTSRRPSSTSHDPRHLRRDWLSGLLQPSAKGTEREAAT